MKKFAILLLLFAIIGSIGALDTESYQFIDHLLRLKSPGQPEPIGDGVLFTASSVYRRVGIAFAHEGFSEVHWFQKLMVIRDDISPEEWQGKKRPEIYHDSGILFFAYTVPQEIRELEYRLIIDGLWSTDPLNPLRRMDNQSGVFRSVVLLPPLPRDVPPAETPGSLSLRYQASPGETITVAGSFNRWDPFMYQMRETSPGYYSLVIPLPPGTYQYVFYHRGQRVLDPLNYRRVYTADRGTVSEAVVK